MTVKTTIYDEVRSRNRPSFFASPIAWAAADFAQSLIDEQGTIVPHHTGMLVISDDCSLSTIRDLSRTAAQGNVSPLRFAGASPSIVAGLPALEQGIRGPAVCLTMPPAHAASAVSALLHYWMYASDVVAVITIAHFPLSESRHLFKGFVARPGSVEISQDVLRLVDCRLREDPCTKETLLRS